MGRSATDGRRRARAPINTAFEGLTTFRGNATRSYYGEGPVPLDPVIGWRVPTARMCSVSSWAIEPERVVRHRVDRASPTSSCSEDGIDRGSRGRLRRHYHFLDGRRACRCGRRSRPATSRRARRRRTPTATRCTTRARATTGSASSRRTGADPLVLWSIDGATSVERPLWNDDWDGAALVVDDFLFEGGENSWLYVIRLNRSYDEHGQVTVDPEVVATIPGFDDELLRALGDTEVSIENSVAFHDGILYFANSGGLVQGWDVSDVLAGGSERGARVPVLDRRRHRRHRRDRRRGRPLRRQRVPAVRGAEPRGGPADEARPLAAERPAGLVDRRAGDRVRGSGRQLVDAGAVRRLVYFTTAAGRVLAVDRETGDIRWERQIGAPAIGSPVVVDGVLIQGDCAGDLWAWDVSEPGRGPGAAVEAALQRLHRVDAGGVARLDLRRHAPGLPLRAHRAGERGRRSLRRRARAASVKQDRWVRADLRSPEGDQRGRGHEQRHETRDGDDATDRRAAGTDRPRSPRRAPRRTRRCARASRSRDREADHAG